MNTKITTAFLVAASLLLTGFCKEQKKKTPQIDGVITYLKGKVTVIKQGKDIKATLGQRVQKDDQIKTAPRGNAIVQFANIGIIKVLSSSEISFSSLDKKGQISIHNHNGNVFSKIAKLRKGQKYRVTTPTAVAGVRGTEFLSRYRNGKSKFYVREGKIAVGPPVATNAMTTDTSVEPDLTASKMVVQEQIIEAGRVGVIEPQVAGVKVRRQTQLEAVKIAKYGAGAEIIENVTEVSVKELEVKQVQITRTLVIAKAQTERKILNIENKHRAQVLLVLKDGSKLKGHIVEQNEKIIKLDDGDIILNIEKKDIVRRESLKKD